MSKVVSITGKPVDTQAEEKPEPCAPLVEILEKLLKDAKAGELQSFIGLGFQSDGDMSYVMCDFHEREFEMYGALQWMANHFYEVHFTDEYAED